MDPRSLPPGALVALLALAAIALGVALTQALARVWARRARRRRIVARVVRAGEGEARALGWLEEMGFEVLGAQVATSYPVTVDDETVAIGVRADYLVRARESGARYVVEVKTGSVAPRIETPATRRQLLEYRVAFDVDGVLLVDAESARVHAVTFPGVGAARAESAGEEEEEARAGGGGAAWTLLLALAALIAMLAMLVAIVRAVA